ncbi:MAG: peptidoglycan-binding protein [Patescibacteria group bacterium]
MIIREYKALKFLGFFLAVALAANFGLTFAPLDWSASADDDTPYEQTFTISAYYSPLEGQEYYVTGSYDGDIRLNGSGVNSADGTPVYPGMVAAPSSYDFGTKMYIPGVGIVAVHDRGGAILEAGERNYNYDRLDIWMGYGDLGLQRALNWGVRDVEITIYGVDPTVEENVYLEGYSDAEKFIKTTVLAPQLFPKDIWYGTDGEDVRKLQSYLGILGYFNSNISGYYGDETAMAVYNFQVDQGIVDDWGQLGAGHFGINSRKAMDKVMVDIDIETELESIEELNDGFQKMQEYADLAENPTYFADYLVFGDRGDDVYALQEELQALGYLLLDPTGYYGEVTEHAVFKLQQRWGLIAGRDDLGAGVVGPQTRGMINSIIGERIDTKSYIALNRDEDTGVYLARE